MGAGVVVTFRVVVYVDVGVVRRADWLATAQFVEEKTARSFAMMQLLHVYLRLDLPKDHSRGYWCEVVRGRYVDEGRERETFDFGALWVADHGDGYVDAAYLDNESGEVTWEAGVARAAWSLLRAVPVPPSS